MEPIYESDIPSYVLSAEKSGPQKKGYSEFIGSEEHNAMVREEVKNSILIRAVKFDLTRGKIVSKF